MSVLEPSKTYKPFKYPWAVEIAEESERLHWTHQETDFSKDVADWQTKLTSQEKNLIHQVLKLFTQSDTQVAAMYLDNLIPAFKNNEIRMMLMSFAAREGVHQRGYSAILEILGMGDVEYEAFLEYKEMYDKIDFMKDNKIDSHTGRALSLVKNIFSEGVSLFGSFIILMSFQRRGLLLNFNEINRWSVLDEGSSHVTGLVKLFLTYIEEHPRIVNDAFKKDIYDMARTIYKLEDKFIDLAFEMGDVEGITKDGVKEYIKYLIDRRLISMGLRGEFGVKDNPMPWFDEIIGAPEFTNFFEGRPTSYVKGGLDGDWIDAW